MVPSLTEIVPFLGIPSVNSDVEAVTGTVPVPIAGEPEELVPGEAELAGEAEEAVALFEEDDASPEDDCSTLCAATVKAAFTRFNAVWLAMLAMPLNWLVITEPIAEIRASLLASDWSRCCALFQ